MRIIGGKCKGQQIVAPAGNNTRPTTDRVREALISSLISAAQSYDIEWEEACVLDPFAGSGALSFELLSRGLGSALLSDKNGAAQSALRKNVSSLGFTWEARLLRLDSFVQRARLAQELKRFLAERGHALKFLVLDPPYAVSAQELSAWLFELAVDLQADDLLVLYEHGKGSAGLSFEQVGDTFELEQVKSKIYGNTAVDLYYVGRRVVE